MNKILTLTLTALLSGCTTIDNVTNKAAMKAEKLGREEIANAVNYTPESKYKSVRFIEKLYVPKLLARERKMPEWYFENWESNSSELSLSEYMQQVQKAFGINVRYLEKVDSDRKFPMYFKGKLGDAIDQMAMATGFSYEIEGNLISWSIFEEDTFDLAFLAGKQSFRLGASENGGRGGSGNESQYGSISIARVGQDNGETESFANVEVGEMDQFSELEASLKILKSDRGKLYLDRASSLLLVRDIPESVRSIRKFVESYKVKVTTNLLIEIKIIEFTKSNGVNNSINWSQVNKTLSDAGVFSLSSAFQTPYVSTTAPLLLGFDRVGGENSGSQIFLEALQNQGTTTIVSEPKILTVSNRVTNVNIGRDRGFAAASSTSVGGLNSVSQNSITPGVLETGTNIFVYPTLDTETGKITVQLNTSFRDFNRFNTFSSGDAKIETPDTNKRKFDLTFVAQSGQTWLVTGYKSKRVESESNTSGVDVPVLDLLFGGSKSSRDVQTETLLLITPRVLGSN